MAGGQNMPNPQRFILLLLLVVGAAQELTAQQLRVQGTQLVNNKGQIVQLRGINWFGFNNKQTMLDGLWAGSESITVDFKTILARIKLMGFNAVRLPFSFTDFNRPPTPFNKLCTTTTLPQLLAASKPPGVTPLKQPAGPFDIVNDGKCNTALPNSSTYARFIWVVQQIARAGLYVMPDNHVRTDEDMFAHNSPDQWIAAWAKLVRDLVKDPVVKSRLIVDLINEPDNTNFNWEDTTKGGKVDRGLTYLYLGAMDAIFKVSPTTLILIEGTGGAKTIQPGSKAVPYWGGFPTDPVLIKANGLSDATPFFKALMSKPYLKNVVLSFHAYSTAVIPWSLVEYMDLWVGAGLAKRYTETFGYLTKKGFCLNGKCQVFPFILGEFSAPKAGNARDSAEINSFADYFSLSGKGNDGQHARIDNWFFWCWNANSGDTGGIVGEGWKNIDFAKVSFLERRYGLKPWYR